MGTYPTEKLLLWIFICLLCTVSHIEAGDCGIPDEVSNATLEDEIAQRDTFEEGSVLKYACSPGYRSPVSQFRICQNGQWVTLFECILIRFDEYCGVPDEVSNAALEDEIAQQDTFEEGSVLKYACSPGYRSPVSQYRICQNGKWVTLFECTRINCGALRHPRNGRRLGDSFFVGDRVSFRCSDGFHLSGPRTMLCRADGQWRPKYPPACPPVKCHENIDFVPNGESTQETSDGTRNIYRKVVKFSCYEGYDLIGSPTRTCQEDGTWSGTQPACTVPSCPDFEELANGVIYYQDEDINKVTHIATIVCNEHFDLFPDIPDGLNQCVGRNQWEYNEFKCEDHSKTILDSRNVSMFTKNDELGDETLLCLPNFTYKERLEVRPGINMGLFWIPPGNRKRQIKLPTVLKSRTKLTSRCYAGYEMYNVVTNEYLGTKTQDFTVMDGKLEPPAINCKEERCLIQNLPGTNLVRGKETFEPGVKVESGIRLERMCDKGYKGEGKRNFKCDRGSLKGFTPCSEASCSIPAIHNSISHENQTVLPNNKKITLACKAGFHLMRFENGDSAEEIQIQCFLGYLSEDLVGLKCEPIGCTLPYTSNVATFKDERTSFRINDTLRNSDIACPSGLILSTVNDFICKGNKIWSEEVKCYEGTKYSIEFKVRDNSIWDLYTGSFCPMLVTMVNEEGTVIGEFSFPATKYPGRKYNTIKWMRYIGKVNRVDITLIPHNGNYDSINMDYINIIVEDDIRYEVYKLNNVESSRRWNFSPQLETSCDRPVIDGMYLEKKVYFGGDTIFSSDIECNPGLVTTLTSVTCKQNGQWTGRMACSQRPELVRGLTVTSSSTHETWGPELAVDGIKIRAPDRCDCCAATNFQYEPWYRVDLGQQYDIHNVSVIGRGGDGDAGHGHNFKNMVISYGINHYSEAQLAHTTDNVYILERSFSDPIPARYLELKLIGTTRFFIICELQIYAIPRSHIESNQQHSKSVDNNGEIMEFYEIEIHSEHSTMGPLHVIIQGDEGNSKELIFTETGLNRGISSKTFGPIPEIRNVMYLTLIYDGWFNTHVVYMKTESSGNEYIGFLDDEKNTQADIHLDELFQPGCKGNEYTQAKHGYGGQGIDRKKVQSDEDCKTWCSERETCKTAYTQRERSGIWCRLITTNRLSSFIFDDAYTKGKMFFRRC